MGFAGQHIESMPGHEPFALEEAVVLGYNVEHLRTAQDLSKTMFANMAGISRPTLNKIEQGTADPQLSIVRRIADALNVTVVQLLTPPRVVPRRIVPGYQTMPTYRMMPLPDPLGAPEISEAAFEELEAVEAFEPYSSVEAISGRETAKVTPQEFEPDKASETPGASEVAETPETPNVASVADALGASELSEEHEGSATPEGEAFEAFEAAEADEAAEEAVSESGEEVALEAPEVLLDHMRRIPIHAPAPMVAPTVSTSQSTGSHMRLGTNS